MKFKFVTLVMIALTVIACNSTKTATNQLTESTIIGMWNLVTLEGKTVSPLKNGRVINLKLGAKNNQVSGFAGCNNFMSSYTLKGNSIEFGPIATTRKACNNQDFNEQYFLSIFSKVASYKTKNHVLSLLGAKGNSLATFNKDNSSKIINKHWKLKTLGGETAKMSENQEKERFFRLKEKNQKVIGFAGCNTFMGSYTLEKDHQISFSQMASTLRSCPDSNVKDSDLLSTFHKAASYTYSHDNLTLFDSEGKSLATFKAIYF